jgi:hypothetical protein
MARQNLLLQKGVPLTRVRQVSTLSRKSTQFLSLMQVCPHPDRRVWVHNLCNWLLRKESMWGKGPLKRENKKILLGHSSLNRQFEIRTLGDKQLFDHKNFARSSNVSQNM